MKNKNLKFTSLTLEESELQQTLKLMTRVFPKATIFSLSYLEWLYRDNPFGTAIGCNALNENGEVIAHYAVVPKEFVCDKGRRYIAALSLNTAVRDDYQGLGLFTELASKTYDECIKRDIRFVYGVANQNSTHGFVKRLGFDLLCALPVQITWGASTDRSSTNLVGMSCNWTQPTWNWRLSRPGAKYLVRKLGTSNSQFQVRSWGSPGAYWDLGVVAFNEVGPLQSDASSFFRFTDFCPRITMGFGLVQQKHFCGIPLPDRFKPAPLNLIRRDLTPGKEPLPDFTNFNVLDFDIL